MEASSRLEEAVQEVLPAAVPAAVPAVGLASVPVGIHEEGHWVAYLEAAALEEAGGLELRLEASHPQGLLHEEASRSRNSRDTHRAVADAEGAA